MHVYIEMDGLTYDLEIALKQIGQKNFQLRANLKSTIALECHRTMLPNCT